MLVAAIASCKNWHEPVGKYGYGPVLLLFGVHSDGLCSVEPVASSVFPHALGAVGHIPAIWYSACHGHMEM